MEKKKIALHIIMPNQVSGPNTANLRISTSWLKEDYDFKFVTQNFHAGSKINLSLIKDLTTQFKEIKPDIVHLSGLQSSGFHAVVAARLAGCNNVIFAIRGLSGDVIGLSKTKKIIFNKIIEPFSLKLCTNFYTVCESASEKKIVQKNKNKYLGVIHNAAPKIKFNKEISRKKFRNELKVNSKTFLIAISGRMVYDKGISFIIDAIKKNDDLDIKFVFIGNGPYYDIIKKDCSDLLTNNKIYLLGKRNDVLEILTGCDLFLFATLHENLSNALLEAMAVGLPVIATNVGGNPEVVRNGENGYLIDPENSNQINKFISKIKNDESLKENFSINSLQIISDKFSQEKLYKTISDLYRSL